MNALHKAAQDGDVEAVKLILSSDSSSVRTKGSGGTSALQLAAIKGHLPVVDLLLSHGANVDARDRSGDTALHWAALGGHADVVAKLLENRAEPNGKNANGLTPLDEAKRHGHQNVVNLLSTHRSTGLDGTLRFLAVCLLFSALLAAIQLYFILLLLGIERGITLNSDGQIKLAALAAVFISALVLNVLFYKRKKVFRPFAIAYILAVNVLNFTIALNSQDTNLQPNTATATSLAAALFWIPYLLGSARCKATFVR